MTTKGAGVQRWPGQFDHQTWEEGPAFRTRSVLWPPGPARGGLSTTRGRTPARDGPGSAATGRTRMGLAEPIEEGHQGGSHRRTLMAGDSRARASDERMGSRTSMGRPIQSPAEPSGKEVLRCVGRSVGGIAGSAKCISTTGLSCAVQTGAFRVGDRRGARHREQSQRPEVARTEAEVQPGQARPAFPAPKKTPGRHGMIRPNVGKLCNPARRKLF